MESHQWLKAGFPEYLVNLNPCQCSLQYELANFNSFSISYPKITPDVLVLVQCGLR